MCSSHLFQTAVEMYQVYVLFVKIKVMTESSSSHLQTNKINSVLHLTLKLLLSFSVIFDPMTSFSGFLS